MKKLLYSIALVALVNCSGFAQCSNYSASVDFQTPVAGSISPVTAGTNGSISFKVSALNLTSFNTFGALITSFTVSGSGGHLSSEPYNYSYSGPSEVTATFNFTVKTPNTAGSESFTVTAIYNTSGATGCTAVGVVSVNTTPIELLAFSGKQNNEGGVHLDWVTASEKNNTMFLVERSNNGNDFTQVGEVKGAGNSSKNINYSFNDGSAVNDAVNYYRLTDVDVDGNKSSSRIISVVVGKNAPLSIYTISAQQGWVSVVSPIAGDAVLNITNAQGQVMSSMKANLTEGDNQVSINTANLNTGIYILSINNNNRTAQTKFFKN